jgi:hypothetical protein
MARIENRPRVLTNAKDDPLRFIGYLFEIAVWPFQAAAKYQAQRNPLSDQQYTPLLLMPALFLFVPLCLLISLVAIAYVLAYVFLVLPFIFICQCLDKLFPDR